MEDDITLGKIVKWGVIILVVGLALDWIFAGENFIMYKVFAPRQAAVERAVYEHTKSYHQGSVQRLGSLCLDLSKSDDDHKSLIKDVIRHEFAEWDLVDVPDHLHSCLIGARGVQ